MARSTAGRRAAQGVAPEPAEVAAPAPILETPAGASPAAATGSSSPATSDVPATPAVPLVPATAAPPAAQQPAVDLASTDRLAIGLSVTRPCWVSASADGKRVIERLMQVGDRQTIDVRRELVLTAGDATAVKMTINGASVKPLGEAGKVVTARVTPTNFKEYLVAR